MKLNITSRGFGFIEFNDAYGQKCSIQDSSSALAPHIWLGVDDTGPNITGPSGQTNETVSNRMHLSLEHIEKLLPILQEFVETKGNYLFNLDSVKKLNE